MKITTIDPAIVHLYGAPPQAVKEALVGRDYRGLQLFARRPSV